MLAVGFAMTEWVQCRRTLKAITALVRINHRRMKLLVSDAGEMWFKKYKCKKIKIIFKEIKTNLQRNNLYFEYISCKIINKIN